MDILRRAIELGEAGVPAALATVVRTSGSVPRHPGAKMLVLGDGSIFGTIGGGRVELEVTAAAAEVAAGAPARLVLHHLVRDLAMCCGGSMELYLEPVAPSAHAIRSAVELYAARRPALLVTPFDGSPKSIDELGGGGRDPRERAPRREEARFVEPIWPADRLLLFGCGHVARAVGPLARTVGFEVAVCDDDETGALSEPPAWATTVVDSFDIRDVTRALGGLGAADYAVIVTRDHAVDQRLLEALLPEVDGLAYLGLIGSRGKVARFHKRLAAKGIATEERWAKLRAPLGLDIGAETPEEIAVALVAELVAVRRRAREPSRFP